MMDDRREYWRRQADGMYHRHGDRWVRDEIDTEARRQGEGERPVSVETANMPQSLWTTYFLGMQCVQFWSDLLNWDRFLEERKEVKALIELGSGSGAFSLYLLMQCIQRGMQFATFEMFPPPAIYYPIAKQLNLGDWCYVEDIWGAGGERIRRMLADDGLHPLVLLCDDGNKPREFREFVPLLRPGDFVAVHDYGNEFTQLDIDAAKLSHLVRETFVAESEERGTLTRWYERI